jgi:hypothetical protein
MGNSIRKIGKVKKTEYHVSGIQKQKGGEHLRQPLKKSVPQTSSIATEISQDSQVQRKQFFLQ